MAINTYTIAEFAGGICRAEIDVDDSNLRVRKGRIINNSDRPANIEIKKAGTVVVTQDIQPNETIEKNLPATIKLTSIPQPNPDEDGPISMGDIEIHVRWG